MSAELLGRGFLFPRASLPPPPTCVSQSLFAAVSLSLSRRCTSHLKVRFSTLIREICRQSQIVPELCRSSHQQP